MAGAIDSTVSLRQRLKGPREGGAEPGDMSYQQYFPGWAAPVAATSDSTVLESLQLPQELVESIRLLCALQEFVIRGPGGPDELLVVNGARIDHLEKAACSLDAARFL